MTVGQFARGLAIGAGLMYLIDPDGGRRRRAALRDRAVHTLRSAERVAGRIRRDARNRARGVVAEARSRLSPDNADDQVIEERVRSAIGRAVTHPGAIEVSVMDGEVLLAGPVLTHEADDLIRAAESARGVVDVIDELDLYESAEGVPALQGGVDRERRFELLQVNWSPTARLITGIGGAAMTLYGPRLPLVFRYPARLLGMGLVARAITNIDTRRLTGRGAGRRAVDIRKSIHVDAPIEQVFGFWSRFENFPRFMSHLREVTQTSDLTSHWVAVGPAGTSFEWDATITEFEENQLIAWQTEPDSAIQHEGRVRFTAEPAGGTRIDIEMSYNPPAGALGHGLAALFGSDPKRAMDEDLVRYKSLIEEGKSTAKGETVYREELVTREGSTELP